MALSIRARITFRYLLRWRIAIWAYFWCIAAMFLFRDSWLFCVAHQLSPARINVTQNHLVRKDSPMDLLRDNRDPDFFLYDDGRIRWSSFVVVAVSVALIASGRLGL